MHTLPTLPPTLSCSVQTPQALVTLSRARSRDQMQLALLQLHQALAAHMAPPPAAVPPSPLLMSPAALSALLTPSGSGFRVDFGAALSAISGGEVEVDPLDVTLEPLLMPPPPPSSKRPSSARQGAIAVKRTRTDESWAGVGPECPTLRLKAVLLVLCVCLVGRAPGWLVVLLVLCVCLVGRAPGWLGFAQCAPSQPVLRPETRPLHAANGRWRR